MSLLMHICFADEMTANGAVEQIRAEAGNLRYEYYFSVADPETLLLIGEWKAQATLDLHHKSKMMQTMAALREKYKLKMRAERYILEK